MKHFIFVLLTMFVGLNVKAQTPEKISYQAVVRDASSNLITGVTVGVRVSILQGTSTGTVVYSETHSANTNSNGLISLEIGGGTLLSGAMTSIDWANDSFFAKIETDPAGGTSYSIIGTTELLSVPYALHAKSASELVKYQVGDFAHGGIIFWVDESGQHGLVCDKNDLSSGMRWSAGTDGNTRSYGDGPFSGEMNTSIICASHVAIGDDGSSYAARMCMELQVTENLKTYGDWYLPSKEELILLSTNVTVVNSTATTYGGTAFGAADYWSSTEKDSSTAFTVNVTSGFQTFVTKNLNFFSVRAIRSF